MSAPDRDDWIDSPSDGWRMAAPDAVTSPGRRVCAPGPCRRGSDGCEIVGAHEMCGTVVRAEPDPWLLLAGEFAASSDVEIVEDRA